MSLALAVLAASSAACDHEVGIADLENGFITAQCERDARCGLYDDAATCLDGARPVGWFAAYLGSMKAGVEAGKIRYDAALAAECLDLITSSSCSLAHASIDETPCERMFQGTIADAGACQYSEECVSGACVRPSCAEDACCAGTCAPSFTGTVPAPGAIGATCAGSGTSACVAGAFCAVAADGSAQCVALRPAGATCGSSEECALGLWCAGSPATCQVPPRRGDACGDHGCDHYDWCDAATDTCRAPLLSGDACDPEDDHCADAALRCGPTSHVCEKPPTIGQACPDRRCAPDAYCDASSITCVALKADGVGCASDAECDGEICTDAGTCSRQPVCF
ncbi:MAG: hypothetical protein K8W52_39975 [Deltaproteobacteria bacterium]|nr:hypothetical protein [Deltaproteobacteria bacterium]